MLRRVALFLLCSILFLSGCQSMGTLAFTQPVGGDTQSSSEAATDLEDTAPPGAQMGAAEFYETFAELIARSGKSLIELGDSAGGGRGNGEELAFHIDDVAIESEYSGDFALHVFAPNGETENVTLKMPRPELKAEDDVPMGDEAALSAVRAFNSARTRERAAFMDCVEAAMRAANKYKGGLSEADVLSVLSDAEKTVKRGSEQSEELSGALTRSFLLDVGYTPQIVFTLEFIL